MNKVIKSVSLSAPGVRSVAVIRFNGDDDEHVVDVFPVLAMVARVVDVVECGSIQTMVEHDALISMAGDCSFPNEGGLATVGEVAADFSDDDRGRWELIPCTWPPGEDGERLAGAIERVKGNVDSFA